MYTNWLNLWYYKVLTGTFVKIHVLLSSVKRCYLIHSEIIIKITSYFLSTEAEANDLKFSFLLANFYSKLNVFCILIFFSKTCNYFAKFFDPISLILRYAIYNTYFKIKNSWNRYYRHVTSYAKNSFYFSVIHLSHVR